jgi:hypothetical protein
MSLQTKEMRPVDEFDSEVVEVAHAPFAMDEHSVVGFVLAAF